MKLDGSNDLPLLAWRPRACQIIPFPMKRRVGKIRRTVEVLSDRSGKGADQYWKQVIGGMRTQMIAAGLPDDIIETELRSFADQVFGKIGRQQNRPGGDAA